MPGDLDTRATLSVKGGGERSGKSHVTNTRLALVIERAVEDTIARERDLLQSAAGRLPKAWGALAARGVLTFRELAGRPPTDAERRALWAGLWRAAEELRARE